MHATAFLKSKSPPETGPFTVLVGTERHLKRSVFDALTRQILGDDDESLGLTQFAGEEVDLKTVCDELRTVSMWGDRRLVLVSDADKFVSLHREGLEKYLQKPAKKSVLTLDVKTWPKTTRLAKAVAKIGLEVECSALSGAELIRWTTEAARTADGKSLSRDAAALLVELAGNDLDLLEQEIAKLASYVGPRSTIESDDVRTLVGGWTTETTWAIAGAMRRGRAGEALDLLSNLLDAGESPHKIFGGMTFVFRRIAQTVERVRSGESLEAALHNSGVFPREIGEASTFLKRIGRREALRIYERLLSADANLKGALTVPERQVLEMFVSNLAAPPSCRS